MFEACIQIINFNFMSSHGFKVAIVGVGNVGTAAAFSMMTGGIVSELVLIDNNEKRIKGLELDLGHANAFNHNFRLNVSKSVEACRGADVVVFTAGARVMPGQTRLDLAKANLALAEELTPGIVKAAPEAVILVVSNPVDVLTHRIAQLAGLPEGRVFGSGTTLDSIRFRWNLAKLTGVHPQSIQADLLGEHGDSSFPFVSGATIGGRKLTEYDDLSESRIQECFVAARDGAKMIRETINFTSYGIGMIINQLVGHIFHDSKVVMPLSVKVRDLYGVNDVTLSLPAILGQRGIEKVIQPMLNETEQVQLLKTANVLKQYLA